MPWLRIKLRASSRDADLVADALTVSGALSVSIEAVDGEQRLQNAREHAALWNENRIVGLFPEAVDTTVVLAAVRTTLEVDSLPYEIDRLDDADWERAWQAHFQPHQITPDLWITPSWCPPPDPTATNVVLDPGLAFGTGAHPSTQLCLAWLAAQPLAGQTVIDYGCGSGILAIAALRLGAARATGVDIDPQALAVSRANAARNGVGERFVACPPDKLAADACADTVIANILSATLIALAPELLARVQPNGRIALSGILAEQAAEVGTAYAARVELTALLRDGWALLAGRRYR